MSTELRDAWTLDPDIAFLNHGSFGATPRAVLEEQSRWRDRLEREPVKFMARDLWAELARVREVLGAFVGANPDDLALVSNATTGVNAVLRSLRFEPGDEVVVTNHGYNACSNTVRFVCERSGAVCRTASIPFPLSSADEVVAAIEGELSPRTKLVLIDHITSPTGLVLPVERIVALLRERGILTLVDGAHAPGMLPLDLDALGADYYSGNLHKWVCAPKGSAFLHVRRDAQADLSPLVISHGRNAPLGDSSRFRLEFDWTGTDDPTAWLCVPKTLEVVGDLVGGWDRVRQRNRELCLRARDVLCAALEIEAPAPDDMLGSLATLPLPATLSTLAVGPFDVDPLQTELFEEAQIEIPIMTWPEAPARVVRLSAQLYNSIEQYETLGAELLNRLRR